MAIAPISSLPNLPPLGATSGVSSLSGASASGPAGVDGSTGGGFSEVLGNAIDSLNQAQSTAAAQEVKSAAGQGTLANTMIAATSASLDTQVATSVIDKALAAYTSISAMTI